LPRGLTGTAALQRVRTGAADLSDAAWRQFRNVAANPNANIDALISEVQSALQQSKSANGRISRASC